MLIGVDFTGAVLRAGVVQGGVVMRTASADAPPPAEPGVVLDSVAELVFSLSKAPRAVGIAIPGEVNTQGRCFRLPNAPGFEGVAIAEEVARRLHCPVAVENRATAAALAERLYGHGRSHPSFLLVTLGTGIGGGLVIGHQLYPGSNGFGAEVGHVCVDNTPGAPLCGCGGRGCLEAFASTRAILQTCAELGGAAPNLESFIERARAGELAAIHTLERVGRALGRALVTVQHLLDLNAIVVAGSITAAFDLIEPYARSELKDQSFAPPLGIVPLLVSQLGEIAGVIGAAHLTTL